MKKKKQKQPTTQEIIPADKSSILNDTEDNISVIGSDKDPCFGKAYDLTTKECKICGDSELCCTKMAMLLGKTRKQLEKENDFKDLETLIDHKAVRKSIRNYTRSGLRKTEILDRLEAKYHITREEARVFYRKLKPKTTQE